MSSGNTLKYGVAQRLFFGPLLFVLHKYDLSKKIEEHGILSQSYADDTTMYLEFYPTSEFSSTLWHVNRVLDNVKKWLNSKLLKLNINKT